MYLKLNYETIRSLLGRLGKACEAVTLWLNRVANVSTLLNDRLIDCQGDASTAPIPVPGTAQANTNHRRPSLDSQSADSNFKQLHFHLYIYSNVFSFSLTNSPLHVITKYCDIHIPLYIYSMNYSLLMEGLFSQEK